MYILKNAIQNLGRNKGRNLLMGVIIFAVIATTAVSIIINTTTSEIIRDYRARFGSEVRITYDYNNLEAVAEYKPLTSEQLLDFGESEHLQSKTINYSVQIVFDGLHALDEDKEGVKVSTASMGAAGQPQEEYLDVMGKLIASSSPNISGDFQQELRRIADGELYSEPNTCMISQQFAELNGLSVGDSITVKTAQLSKPMPYTLTISGIFEDDTMREGNVPEIYHMFPSASTNRNNEILTSAETAKNMEMANDPMSAYVNATYYLKSPTLLGDFQKELTEKGMPGYYVVSTDDYNYNRIVGPVEGLAKVTNTFLIVVLVLGSVILILLSALVIRERKYEIGVLRAMGMKKGKVALGLLCEMMVITLICLLLGLGVGSTASQPVADSLLADQIERATSNEGGMGMAVAINDSEAAEPTLSQVDIHLEWEAVLKIVLISLGLAGASSIVGILYITKYEPMKILSERN